MTTGKAEGKSIDTPPPNPYTAKDERLEFASALALLHAKAGQLGLYQTMHMVHEAVKMVGYEIAGTPQLYEKIEKLRRKSWKT